MLDRLPCQLLLLLFQVFLLCIFPLKENVKLVSQLKTKKAPNIPIGLATPTASVVPVVLLVVVVLMEASVTVPGRWLLLLLLLLMRRVIVLVLMRVMVVLMILRIAIGHRISSATVSSCGCRAIYQMICRRIAGGAIVQLASIAPTSGTCRNHHLLVIAGEMPLQVMLLLL